MDSSSSVFPFFPKFLFLSFSYYERTSFLAFFFAFQQQKVFAQEEEGEPEKLLRSTRATDRLSSVDSRVMDRARVVYTLYKPQMPPLLSFLRSKLLLHLLCLTDLVADAVHAVVSDPCVSRCPQSRQPRQTSLGIRNSFYHRYISPFPSSLSATPWPSPLSLFHSLAASLLAVPGQD